MLNSPENYSDLKECIGKANDGDTINLNGTYFFEDEIAITKSINIIGSDKATITVDSFSTYYGIFFNISSSNVVLSNLKFTSISGCAIYSSGNDNSIINCEFNACTAVNGTVRIEGTNCNVTNCNFINNKATNGIGGAIWWFADNGIIKNCNFNNNFANAAGAIALIANNGLIENCTFTRNYANRYGGAIVVSGQENNIINSKFNSNYVSGDLNYGLGGGAIYSDCLSLNIGACNFNNNYASKTNGGAIILGKNNFVLDSYFKGNLAKSGNNIYGNSSSLINNNHFVINYNESEKNSIYGKDLIITGNKIEKIKIDSKVSFIAGMIFEYGSSGSIYVSVDGGKVELSKIKVLKHSEAKISLSKNVITVSGLAVGKYTLRVTTTPDENHNSVYKDLTVTVKKAAAVIKASKVTVALKKATYWSIKLINSKTKKPISKMKLTLKVYTGKKYKKVSVTTNSKGVAKYKTSKLTRGTHKIVVSAKHKGYTFKTLKSSIKVIKPKKLKFKVKHLFDYDGSTLSITVKNKKKPVNGIKIKLFVYTGKKYKTVVLKSKTNEKFKGVCGWGTNKLSVGTHKVIIKPVSIKYTGFKKTKIKIKKSAKKHVAWETKI